MLKCEKMDIVSHIKYNEKAKSWKIQSNQEHQLGVAKLASKFANEFDMAEWGYVIGLLHDKGKEQKSFQQHILKSSGFSPDTIVDGNSDHAYVGALVAKKLFSTPPYYMMMDNIIMGHHRGLYDDDVKRVKLDNDIPEGVCLERIQTSLTMPKVEHPKDLHHLIRMLYSCLVDADFLDTELFMLPEQSNLRGRKSSIENLLSKLETYLHDLRLNAPSTEVNNIRSEIQDYCIAESERDIDFYSLTVPTGGGKTLSSILWALRHAKRNGQRRIIIAIPYTSIITQTASILRNIFGEDNVLEHHSNVDFNDISEGQMSYRMKLATENWDYPIIVTTNVQLFESLFGNKPSDCRKLHNIVNSVLILDEIQTLPMDFLQPIVDTLDSLKRVFKVSCLFTTASQPILSGRIEGANYLTSFKALHHVNEIVPRNADLHNRFRRVKLDFNNSRQSYDEIAQKISQQRRVLCIVNTRKDAKEIYSRLPNDGECLHLSRMMCPAHIKEVIEKIKRILKDDNQSNVRVVATQLIEAGVDIDFPVVFRQEAGLDSILQAAGRCNREGLMDISTTYVFSLDHPLPPGHLSQTNNARKNMVGDYDWFSPEAIREYFRQLHSRIECFDKPQIQQLLYSSQMYFETAANKFKLIDDNTTSVIVNWGKIVVSLVNKLQAEGCSYHLMKQLSQYSVNIRNRDLKILQDLKAIEEVSENIFFIRDPKFYDEKTGLTVVNNWLEESLII